MKSRWLTRRVAVPGVAVLTALLLALGLLSSPSSASHVRQANAATMKVAAHLRTTQLAKAATWKPASGTAFNYPRAGAKARSQLIRRVLAGINHAPKGSYIRFAIYSFDRRDVADALVKARKRGVNVQIVLNDNWTSAQTYRLKRLLGSNVSKKNFVRVCQSSCRGGKGNLHMKVYAFSQTGAATKVIMTGSSNLTDRAVSLQWNDLVTFRNAPGLYDVFVKVFNQLKRDRRVSPRRISYTSGDLGALFYKTDNPTESVATEILRKFPGPERGPVFKRLSAVSCKAKPGYGSNGKTVIRIIMYGWNKERGKYLADKVADLKRRGCIISVITSVAGGLVVQKLNQAHIPLKSADYNYLVDDLGEETVNFYSHLKVMTLNGTYNGVGTKTVWTGSENWSGTSFLNDELILQLTGANVYKTYLSHFQYLWNNYTHAVGYHPPELP